MSRRIIIHNHLPRRARDSYRRVTYEHYDETPSAPATKKEQEEAKKKLEERKAKFLEGHNNDADPERLKRMREQLASAEALMKRSSSNSQSAQAANSVARLRREIKQLENS